MLESYLTPDCGNDHYCQSCESPAKQNPETGRWYLTMGHAGYNSPANNRDGYASRNAALAAYRRYSGRSKK